MKRFILITVLLLGFKSYLFAQMPETVSVTWTNTTLTYNGSLQTPTATAINGLGQNVPLIVTVAMGDGIAAGFHLAEANPVDPGAYMILSATQICSYEITRYTLPILWGNTSFIYNGFLQLPSATAVGVFGETIPSTVSLFTGDGINVGSHAASVLITTIDLGNNYTYNNIPAAFDILPATIAVQWGNTVLDWDGFPQAPDATWTDLFGVTLPLAVSGAETNIGSGYMATATFSTLVTNYVLSNTTTAFSIGLPPNPHIFLVYWDNTSLSYNGHPQTPYAFAINYLGVSEPIIFSGEETDAGTGYVAWAHTADPYADAYLVNDSTLFDISPASISILWSNTSMTYSGNPQKPGATLTGFYGEKIPLIITGEQTNAGTGYTANASLQNPDKNIILSDTTTLFNIAPANVNILWSNTTFLYDGFPHVPTATARDVFRKILPLTVTGEQTDAGDGYTAAASLVTPDSNYLITNPTTLFSILSEPYTVVIEWSNTSLVYNGFPQAPTAIARDANGDFLPLTVTGAQTNAGTSYTATASVDDVYNEYIFSNLTTLFDIAPQTLYISAVSATIDYGQTPVLEYAVTSGQLFGSDALTGALSVVEMQYGTSLQPPYPVGVYAIVQGTLAASSNYLIVFTEGTLTVRSLSTEIFEVIVNDNTLQLEGDKFYYIAINGEPQAIVNIIADGAVAINGIYQNPRAVDLTKYGENVFTIIITAPNGDTQEYVLVIIRYYETVFFEYPDVPTISCNPLTNGGFVFTGFQWYRDGALIPDAKNPYYKINDNATYYCELTLNDGSKIRTIDIRSQTLRSSDVLTAFPNPTQGKVTIQQSLNGGLSQTEPSGNAKIQVFDAHGALVLQPVTNPFDMSALPQGLYFIRWNGETVRVYKVN